MPAYRFYKIKDDHVTAPATMQECGSDKAALEAARALVDGGDIEVWQGSRRIGLVTCEDGKSKPEPE